MARRVFFSFHYEKDLWRTHQVRNNWVTRPDREATGFWNALLWQEAKKEGVEAIKRMINDGLKNTSVTVILVGSQTSNSKYVNYEIRKSYKRGNGLLAVYIHTLKNQDGYTDYKGNSPLDNFYITQDGRKVYLSEIYPTHDWADDDGYNNFAQWIEKAAEQTDK